MGFPWSYALNRCAQMHSAGSFDMLSVFQGTTADTLGEEDDWTSRQIDQETTRMTVTSAYDEPDELPDATAFEICQVLQSHLNTSQLYDVMRVLRVVEGTKLYNEQVRAVVRSLSSIGMLLRVCSYCLLLDICVSRVSLGSGD